MRRCTALLAVVGLLGTALANSYDSPPHIIIFMADDLGWNDVGFHGSTQIPTPNIDALAYNGIILNRHYVLPSCTPTRTAFLSGKYPITMGMQGSGIQGGEPRGLPLNVRLLPEYLQGLGYDTKLIGKWHVGYHTPRHTPNHRGFDYFLGFYNSFIGYYDYRYAQRNLSGFDMHANDMPAYGTEGQYATDFFTNAALDVISRHDLSRPLYLQVSHLAPHYPLDPVFDWNDEDFRHITDPNRQNYARAVARLDESLGRIVSSLGDKGMLKNSVILFMTDNGGATIGRNRNFASNWPLKGTKYSLFEGGVRGVAAIWSPRLLSKGRVSEQLIHVTDWLPTLYSIAGGDLRDLDRVDGVNQWDVLSIGTGNVRQKILLNIDDATNVEAAIFQRFKLIRGSAYRGYYDNVEGETGRGHNAPHYNTTRILKSAVSDAIREHLGVPVTQESVMWQLQSQATVLCWPNVTNGPRYVNRDRPVSCNATDCLFDLTVDPCETINIAKTYPRQVQELDIILSEYRNMMVPQLQLPVDEMANPSHWNFTWQPWLHNYDMRSYYASTASAIGTVAVCAHVGLFLVIVGLKAFI